MMRIFLLLAAFVFPLVCPGQAADKSLELRFFVVSDAPVAGKKLFDSPAFPKLGYIAEKPDLVFKQLKSVTRENPDPAIEAKIAEALKGHPNVSSPKAYWVVVKLGPTDAMTLEKFTSANLHHQILMTFGDVPLLAPNLDDTISGGSFQISTPDSVQADKLKAKLEGLVPKSK